MMRGDAIDDHRILAVASRYFDAELDVSALVFVGENFSDVVEQCAPTREVYIEAQLGGHYSGQPRDFL